jgi:DNA-binding MarR family transcriptional regulator
MTMPRADLSRKPLPITLNRETFVPSYLSLVAHAHTSGGSRAYSEKFGVSSPDFAILSTLSNHPGVVASEISVIVALDKSVVSRRLQRLMARDLVAAELDAGQRRLYLTGEGVHVHNRVLPIALEREQLLLAGLSDDEVILLRSLLRRMYENIPEMNATEQ